MKSGDPTREVDSSSGGSGIREFDKICVIIELLNVCCKRKWERRVYCIDVNSSLSSSSLERPVFRWNMNLLHFDAYVILGSKLYLFAGPVDFCYYDFKTDLSSTSSKPTVIREESLVRGPPMKSEKSNPVAVVIGDSKICVFPRLLGGPLFAKGSCSTSFELLDTRLPLKWKSLPELPFKYHDNCNVIASYCVHRSFLIIRFLKSGVYAIDVYMPRPQWVRLGQCPRKNPFPFQGMFAIVDEMMINPCPYPLTTIQPLKPTRKYLLCTSRPLGALCFEHTSKNLCRVQVEFPSDDDDDDDYDAPCLLLDFIKFDHLPLDTFGSNLSDWANLPSYKSLTFALTSCRSEDITSISIFPIKTSYIDESMEEEELSKKKKNLAEKEGRRKRQMKNKMKFYQRHVLRRGLIMKKRRFSTAKH
ncbi:hypothetical protein M5689_008258 [Euphorbia peplus]|nr:hypothetical protein M5689_008258 [Euphorbia peplus]